jgi:cephalosporin hydroxylase
MSASGNVANERRAGWIRKLARFLKHPHVSIGFRIARRLDRAAIDRTHRVLSRARAYNDTRWFGARSIKSPLDLWIYQEIIDETRPEAIVETGTFEGGSAAYLADICDLAGVGEIISIDLNPVSPDYPQHRRITYLGGRSSIDPEVVEEVRRRVEGKRTMVILDSDHSQAHVEAELDAYASLVSPECYLIVEDTNIGLIRPDLLPGPAQAVQVFLLRSDLFEVDLSRERYLLSFHPGGYLRRTSAP